MPKIVEEHKPLGEVMFKIFCSLSMLTREDKFTFDKL